MTFDIKTLLWGFSEDRDIGRAGLKALQGGPGKVSGCALSSAHATTVRGAETSPLEERPTGKPGMGTDTQTTGSAPALS